MSVFVAGLRFGAMSGALTYGMSSFDGPLALVTAGVACVLTWIGCASIFLPRR
jgi:hypothetical protein